MKLCRYLLLLLLLIGPLVRADHDEPNPTPSCGTELASAPPRHPPGWRFRPRIDARVATVHEALAYFLLPTELARFEEALGVVGALDPAAAADSPELALAGALFERALAALRRDVLDTLDAKRAELESQRLRARELNNQGTAEKIVQVSARLDVCRDPRALEPCAQAWLAYQNAMRAGLVPMLPRLTASGPVNRPIDEVDKLDILGDASQKTKFKLALEDAFRSPRAERRESGAFTRLNHWSGFPDYTFVNDLNQALTTLFLEPPKRVKNTSKVILQARVRIGAGSAPVDVVFDPRMRYFTIMPSDATELDANYYRASYAADGTLTIADPRPVPRSRVTEHLGQTHFTY